jgi:hypothetical protein
MEDIAQPLPEQLRIDFLSQAIDTPQAKIVDKAVAELESGSNVAVILPAGLERVLISQGVALELSRSRAQDHPKVLVIVSSDLALENYLKGSTWLDALLPADRIDKHTLKSQLSVRQLLASSSILVSTSEQLREGLKWGQIRFDQLDQFNLVVVDAYSDSSKLESFREDLKTLLGLLTKRKLQLLFLAKDTSISNRQEPPWGNIPNLRKIKAKKGWRKGLQPPKPASRETAPPWRRTGRMAWRGAARSRASGQRERISIGGLERLFWIGLVVSLIVFNFQLLPLRLILSNGTYLIREIAPVMVGLVLTLAGVKVAIYIVAAWRPEFPYKLVVFLKKTVARTLHTSEEEPEEEPEGEPGYLHGVGAEYAKSGEVESGKWTRATGPSYADGLIFLALALLSGLSLLLTNRGPFTEGWLRLLHGLVSWGTYLTPFVLGLIGIWLLRCFAAEKPEEKWGPPLVGLVLLFLVLLAVFHLIQPGAGFDNFDEPGGGGLLGWAIGQLLVSAVGIAGSVVTLAVLSVISLALIFGLSLVELVEMVRNTPDQINDWRRRRALALDTLDREPIMADFKLQWKTSYSLGMDNFDQSSGIEGENEQYLGDVGIGIAQMGVLDPKETPRRAMAFEVWLFDKGRGTLKTTTVTKVLMSDFAYLAEAVRKKLMSRGENEAFEPVLATPGGTFTLETDFLVAEAHVVKMEYGEGSPPLAYFKTLTVNFDVTQKPEVMGSPDKQPQASFKAASAEKKATLWQRVLAGHAAAPEKLVEQTGAYVLPDISRILDQASYQTTSSQEADLQRARIIEETLRSFGVPAEVKEIKAGPAVTQFDIEPGYVERPGPDGSLQRHRVRVSKISTLVNDLALALSATPIRIEAPVPGRPYVGIEVPNAAKSLVSLRSVMESKNFQNDKSPLRFGLGRDVAGQAVVADLAAMPHLLIAGATGSGKSVCINAIIACFLATHTPETLRLLMVDPKMVELTNYNGVPHLLAPVVTDLEQAVDALNWATREMDRRYVVFSRLGVRNLVGYNELMASHGEKVMPYIVIIIDELADLMMMSPDEVERTVTRIAQMARATGIHLIIATQRPSVDVVTGLIKANFPARIAFAVTSQIDSRVILDTPGAELLLGRGDLLIMLPDSPKLQRLQGCFVSDAEMRKIVAFWEQAGGELPAASCPWDGLLDKVEKDDRLKEAIAIVTKSGRASTTFLQRQLGIGHRRASRLMAQLEEEGIIGPAEGGRPRQVLVSGDYTDESDEA